METRNENIKRKRKLVERKPTLVRSVKPGQTSAQVWERRNTSLANLWNIGTTAA